MHYRVLFTFLVLLYGLAPQFSQAGDAVLPEVEKIGQGDTTLLIIPCMSCRWKSWETFMQRNSDRYTMYAVTLPGFGGTARPDLPLNSDGTPWRDNALKQLSDLMQSEKMRDVVVVGHSFGTMVAVQLAVRNPDRIVKLINVDGSIYASVSESWEQRLSAAAGIVEQQTRNLADPETWRRFNGGQPDSSRPRTTEPTMPRHRSILYHGMFMATDRVSLIQYWRENVIIDLDAELMKTTIPILDIEAFSAGDLEEQKKAYLQGLQEAGNPSNVTTVFLPETSHFVMEHRPELLDQLIADFLAGKKLSLPDKP